MDIVLIHPDNLRACWPDVRKGLDAMPAEDWIAEDVYHEIRAGHSALHVAVDTNGFAGFMVLTKRTTEYTKQPILHVWLAYNEGDADIIDAGLGIIRDTAARLGAQKITFGSPRKGWAKRFPLVTSTYEIPR